MVAIDLPSNLLFTVLQPRVPRRGGRTKSTLSIGGDDEEWTLSSIWITVGVVLGVAWLAYVLVLWIFFHDRAKKKNPGIPQPLARSFRKALMLATFITVIIWMVKKIRGMFKKDGKDTKDGAAHEKVDEDRTRLVPQNDEELAGGGVRTSTEALSATTPSPLYSREPSPAPGRPPSYDTVHPVPPPAVAQAFNPLAK